MAKNLQIFYKKLPKNKTDNFFINKNIVYIPNNKAKINNKKCIPLNALLKKDKIINKKIKLKNIILKLSNKKYNFQKDFKYSFKLWKSLLNKDINLNQNEKKIKNNSTYKPIINENNKIKKKFPFKLKNNQKDYFGYNSILNICNQINITIRNKKFIFLNNSNSKNHSLYFNQNKNDKEKNMELFVAKNVNNRNFVLQKQDNFAFKRIY